MSFLGPTTDPVRQQLIDIRNELLKLHKALLDSERAVYEKDHGRIESPGAFLQLLLGDPWFSWLKPVTDLVVQIDETLSARDLANRDDFRRLIAQTQELLDPEVDENGFFERYNYVVSRDVDVAFLHVQVVGRLRKSGRLQ
jgi:hypothetical protein